MRQFIMAMILAASPSLGQATDTPSVIRVMGHGSVKTAPDMAVITFSVRGEGITSDDAMRALVAKRERIGAALAGKADIRTGKLAVQAVRDKACDGHDEEEDKPRLSTGVCAIKGYVATLGMTAKITVVAEAGTLLGLASRLGATDPSLGEFELANPAIAQRAAIADAIRDAREQATAIAAASRIALGRLRRVEDQRATDLGAQDIVVTAFANRVPADRLQPVIVALAPAPIESSASLVVEFEIGGTAP